MKKLDKIFDKIEKIRRQPENVRLRWVYGLTAASMVIVFIIWMLSIASMRSNMNGRDNYSGQSQDIFNELQTQKESIKDAAGDIKNVLDQGASMDTQENSNDNSSGLDVSENTNEGFSGN